MWTGLKEEAHYDTTKRNSRRDEKVKDNEAISENLGVQQTPKKAIYTNNS